jgi:hypothetical protein
VEIDLESGTAKNATPIEGPALLRLNSVDAINKWRADRDSIQSETATVTLRFFIPGCEQR